MSGTAGAGAARAEAALRLMRAIRLVPEGGAVERLLDGLARPDGPIVLAFVNAHAFNLAWEDAGFAADLAAAEVKLRDGAGLAILCRMLGQEPGANLNGTDLIPALLDRFAGRPVALFGTAEPWLSGAAQWAEARGARVAARADGFRPDGAYAPIARGSGAELIVLGMGMPRQERLARELAATLDRPCLIVAGGAILDFWGGRFPRAPRWMRAAGLEWLYRLSREPKRLWRRYVRGNPVFLIRALKVRRAARQASRGTQA